MKRKHSLLMRAMAADAAVGGATVLVLAAVLLFAVRSAMDEQLLVRAREMTQFLSAQCQYPMLVGDRVALHQLAVNALKNTDVLYLDITEAGGATSFASTKPGVRVPAALSQQSGDRFVSVATEAAIEVARPVSAPQSSGMYDWDVGGPPHADLGTLRIGFSLGKKDELFARILRATIAASLLLMGLSLPLRYWDMKRLLAPLHGLELFTQKVGAGNLSERARLIRRDEVGALTIAFNQMLDQLGSTTVSRNYLDNVIQSMAESLIVVGRDDLIESVNQATLDMLGYTEKDLLGQPAAMVSKSVERSVSKRESVMSTYRASDGRAIPVLFSCSALNSPTGSSRGMVWLAQDVTEKKRAQEELVTAKEAAEQASRAKSAFLATMSHELRTPLNAILGFSQLLVVEMEDLGMPQWEGDLQKIQRAGNHLLAVINDILDLSRIEAGKVELASADFDIGCVIEDVAASLQPLALKNGNGISIGCEAAVLRGDAMRVQQCLMNLIGNACKFTHDGHIRVEELLERYEDEEWCRISVMDSGIGIPPEAIEHLFREFSQVDTSTTRKYGGSGLGLAISRRLCRMMGGDITVESMLGQGTTFTMRLPAGRVHGQRPAPAPEAATQVLGDFNGEKVVYAENTGS